MSCKPGVAGSTFGFSIKLLSVEPWEFPSLNTHTTITLPAHYWLLPMEKPQKAGFFITVGNFAFLINCTPVGRTSDSMTVPT